MRNYVRHFVAYLRIYLYVYVCALDHSITQVHIELYKVDRKSIKSCERIHARALLISCLCALSHSLFRSPSARICVITLHRKKIQYPSSR